MVDAGHVALAVSAFSALGYGLGCLKLADRQRKVADGLQKTVGYLHDKNQTLASMNRNLNREIYRHSSDADAAYVRADAAAMDMQRLLNIARLTIEEQRQTINTLTARVPPCWRVHQTPGSYPEVPQ